MNVIFIGQAIIASIWLLQYIRFKIMEGLKEAVIWKGVEGKGFVGYF